MWSGNWNQGFWYLHTRVHSIIHKSQKMEQTQVSICRWMHEYNVYIHSGLLSSLKKEESSETCSKWMNLQDIV